MSTADDAAERYDARTRGPQSQKTATGLERLADAFLTIWDHGDKDGLAETLRELGPVTAAAVSAVVAVRLHERNVVDGSDWVEFLNAARNL